MTRFNSPMLAVASLSVRTSLCQNNAAMAVSLKLKVGGRDTLRLATAVWPLRGFLPRRTGWAAPVRRGGGRSTTVNRGAHADRKDRAADGRRSTVRRALFCLSSL